MFTQNIVFLELKKKSSYYFEDMIERGFHAKYKKNEKWKPSEVIILKDAIKELVSAPHPPQQRDWSYYISHYIFHDSKSTSQVQYMINKHIRRIMSRTH
jgi:hypothetical protein